MYLSDEVTKRLQNVCDDYATYPTSSTRWALTVLLEAIKRKYDIKIYKQQFGKSVENIMAELPDDPR